MRKVAKLNIEADSLGINLNIDGASEGILIEYEILPKAAKAVLAEILDRQKETRHSGASAELLPKVRAYRYDTFDDERVALHLPQGTEVVDVTVGEAQQLAGRLAQLAG